MYLRINALLLICLWGYSTAQSEAFSPPSLDEIQAVSPDSVPDLMLIAPPPPPPPPVATSSPSTSSSAPYRSYEDYLDSILIYARNILPGKQELETQKALIMEKGPEPKGEYEKQADYDSRMANFDKNKQKEIANLEKKHEAEMKARKEKLKNTVYYKPDIAHPNWDGMLRADTTADGYNARIAKIESMMSFMKTKITNTMQMLDNLDVLNKNDMNVLEQKNRLYMARMARAIELMEDYILQDYAKVMSTERRKFDMVFGVYDPEKEQFHVDMTDYHSQKVPFNYVGSLKVSPAVAQEIDRKTDNFLASIDYVNFPFVVDGNKVFPGAKKAEIYYKDKAVPGTGNFKNVPGYENLDGYIEWAVRADSLISGKLVPRKLDSAYVMSKSLPKKSSGGTWWSRNKNLVGTILFIAAAGSAGVAVWQDMEAGKQKDNAAIWYTNAEHAVVEQNTGQYAVNSAGYKKAVDNVRFHENMRNGLYIGAGAFGIAGILSLCF